MNGVDMDIDNESRSTTASSSVNNMTPSGMQNYDNDSTDMEKDDDDDDDDVNVNNNNSGVNVAFQDNDSETESEEEEESTVTTATTSPQKHYQQYRSVNLVLTKKSTSISNTKTTTSNNTDNDTSTPSTSAVVATSTANSSRSPLRIKLSLKKLPNATITNQPTVPLNPLNDTNDSTELTKDSSILKNDPTTTNDLNPSNATSTFKESLTKESNKGLSTVQQPTKSSSSSPQKRPSILKKSSSMNVSVSVPPTATTTNTTVQKQHRPIVPSKQVRIPPLTSPGLCLLRPPGPLPTISSDVGSNITPPSTPIMTTKCITPQQIFDIVMTSAGYTYEQRTMYPHRGSSVQRTIDDMYDTNISLLSLYQPNKVKKLIPPHLWDYKYDKDKSTSRSGSNSTNIKNQESLPIILIQGLEESKVKERQNEIESMKNDMHPNSSTYGSRKRPRQHSGKPTPFRDMVPVSLTLPYPDWYKKKRVEYVSQVKQREDAIIQWQEAQEELEMNDADDHEIGVASSSSSMNPIIIPPIPQLPDPPKLNELFQAAHVEGGESSQLNNILARSYGYHVDKPLDVSTHPFYIPKANGINLVDHLDPNCFHITNGRYFGLQTNLIADPNYSGPNAPGLSTANTNTGGLATATTSTTTSTSGLTGGGMTMIFSTSYHSAAAVAPKDELPNVATSNKPSTISNDEELIVNANTPDKKVLPLSSTPPSVTSSPSTTPFRASPIEKPNTGINNNRCNLVCTRTLSDLRKIMEGDDEPLIARFREYITRTIVHIYRTKKITTMPFQGPDHEIYPDIGKAFAWFGGVKTCDRCRSNKQGVFHCRLRRRHDDVDYDGGNTCGVVLRPLLDVPIDKLLPAANNK